ncbi:MAG: molecular chaperone TorD family protein [Sandaracinaceae bacterium]|nr:molecular chaperone TorD family protein [Sandaracinaceae bacterium]
MTGADGLVAAELERAATYRFLSLLFVPPTDEVGQELAELAAVVAPALREDAALVGRSTGRAIEGLYHRVLGPSGQVPDTECAFDDNTAGGRGQLIGDVAGFYEAFAFAAAPGSTADHVANELGFLGWLAIKRAYAHHAGADEEGATTDGARAAFLRDHLGRWAIAFLERLAQVGEGTHYEAVAALASRTLRALEGDDAFVRPSSKTRLPVLDEPGELDCS